VDLLEGLQALADQLAALLNLVVPPALEALETSMELHLLVDLQG
jgi:hypothetical protein